MRFLPLLALLVACSRAPSSRPAPVAVTKSLQPSQNVSPLAARLQYEAAHRPASPLSAEHVFDALEHAGIAIADRTQYAGVVMKASYCAGGRGQGGLVVAICEYPTHDAALAGKAYMDRSFPLATAQREVRGTTVMTAVGAGRERALSAFQTL